MGFEADFEKWKLDFFGNYCMSKCDRTCCDMKNVSLSVNQKELEWIFGKKISPEDFKRTGIRKIRPNCTYSIETKDFCRKFDSHTRKCTGYDRRPASCREFPFFVEKDAIVIKNGCKFGKGTLEYGKLTEMAAYYGKVIVKR